MIYAVIAAHNEPLVGEAIQSIKGQTHDTKIVLVDDGSSDETFNIAMREIFDSQAILGRIEDNYEIYTNATGNILIKSLKNLGASAARNKAVSLVLNKASHILIQDADDISLPNKIERLLTGFKPGIAVCYADYYIENQLSGIKIPEFKVPYDYRTLQYDCIVHSQALISCAVLREIWAFDQKIWDPQLHGPRTEGFRGSMEDWGLWKMLSVKYMMWHLPELLSVVRCTGRNQSNPNKITNEIYQKNMSIIHERVKRYVTAIEKEIK